MGHARVNIGMKKLLLNCGRWVLGIVLTTVLASLITGQPLSGLTKLKGLYQTFAHGTAPAWSFAVALLWALSSTYYAVRFLPRRLSKGRVHFVPDAHNSGWARQSDTTMAVRIGGTFTYEGAGNVALLKAFVTGTRPVTDMVVTIPAWNTSGRPITVSQITLEGGAPATAVIQVYLSPVTGTPGQPLRTELVFRDPFNRDFSVGRIKLPYLGPP